MYTVVGRQAPFRDVSRKEVCMLELQIERTQNVDVKKKM